MAGVKYSIGKLSSCLKVKYLTIKTILGDEFLNDWNGGYDIYLDLNSLFKSASGSAKYLQGIPFADNVEADMVNTILETLLHWKNFTRRKYENVRIFLLWNNTEMICSPEREIINSYLLPYQQKFSQDRFAQLVYSWTESIKIVQNILNFVPNSYLIRCTRADSFIVPEIVRSLTPVSTKRIIVSSSPIFTQYMFEPDTKVIYTRYIHTGMQQISNPIDITKAISHIDEPIMEQFTKSKVFYGALNAIVGDFDRGLIGVTNAGITKLSADILRGVEKREIPEDPKSIDSIMYVMNPNVQEYVKRAFMLIDIKSHLNLIPESIKLKVKEQMIDKYDVDSLAKLSVEGMNLLELL